MRGLDLGMLPASYLVSRNKVQLYCFVGFLMYYADCMLVFRDDYVMASGSAVSHEAFFIGDPAFSIIFGCATLMSFWLMVCAYVEEDSIIVRFGPAYLFVGASLAVTLFLRKGMCTCSCSIRCARCSSPGCCFSQHINTSPPRTIGYGCD